MTTKARSLYISNVKKGLKIYEAMAALEDNGKIYMTYDGETYDINCHIFNKMKSYTISDGKPFGRSMNLDMDKSNKTSLYAYTYDLFSNKSANRIHFQYVKVTAKPEEDK
jgi:predicted heme/steroid binding protein